MRLMVEVPLNTMLADLDDTLRGLVPDELERIATDAPRGPTLDGHRGEGSDVSE